LTVEIHHIAMRTFDVVRLERFYTRVLGLAVVRRDDARGTVWLGAGSAILMLERAEAGESGALSSAGEGGAPTHSLELVAFAVADGEAWRTRLTEATVSIEAETPHTLYFRDPDGRRIGVSTYPGELHLAADM
jgi:catechol 2,3-dioxygenase-like lactoylglutathione lyase family enzyme